MKTEKLILKQLKRLYNYNSDKTFPLDGTFENGLIIHRDNNEGSEFKINYFYNIKNNNIEKITWKCEDGYNDILNDNELEEHLDYLKYQIEK